MDDFAERISKVGRFFLYLLVALSIAQIILRALGVDISIPGVTQFIELIVKLFSVFAKAANKLLSSHVGY